MHAFLYSILGLLRLYFTENNQFLSIPPWAYTDEITVMS